MKEANELSEKKREKKSSERNEKKINEKMRPGINLTILKILNDFWDSRGWIHFFFLYSFPSSFTSLKYVFPFIGEDMTIIIFFHIDHHSKKGKILRKRKSLRERF